MLTFFGMGRIKQNKAEEFEKALKAYWPHCLAEEGTLHYVVYRGTDDPLLVTFHEIYRDDAAKKAHHASPHLQEFIQILKKCREENVMMGFCEELIAKR